MWAEPADIETMIISDEQARLAAAELKHPHQHHDEIAHQTVSAAVLAAAHDLALSAPDVRSERLDDARTRLMSGLDSHDVAEKMLSRIVSDALR